MQPVVIGIAGGSGAGKTTLVGAIRARLACQSATLAFDNYYRDQRHLDLAQRAQINYDHPDSLDVARFTADLASIKTGRAVPIPLYDFATHCRAREEEVLLPEPVIFADGILLLAFPEIRAELHVSVFLHADEQLRLQRRVLRDVRDRGRTAEAVHTQFAATVAPMHDRFVAPSAEHADVVISGADDIPDEVRAVTELLPPELTTREAAGY